MAQAIAIPIIAAVTAAAAGAGVAALTAPKPVKPPVPLPPVTRNAALADAFNNDSAFRHRQGAAATMLTGPNGAEAPSPGAKALLGQ